MLTPLSRAFFPVIPHTRIQNCLCPPIRSAYLKLFANSQSQKRPKGRTGAAKRVQGKIHIHDADFDHVDADHTGNPKDLNQQGSAVLH